MSAILELFVGECELCPEGVARVTKNGRCLEHDHDRMLMQEAEAWALNRLGPERRRKMLKEMSK